MTGMPSSKVIPCVSLALLAWVGNCHADELSLTGDAKLSGTIRSIDKSGVVELASDLSPESVRLTPDAVEKITFGNNGSPFETPSSLIELVNGDLLPSQIEDFDGKVLNVLTPDAGNLAIPRDALKSMQFGVRRQKAIYSGPRNIEEWTAHPDGAKNWRFARGVLTASGSAIAVRKIEVPPRFVLKFKLKWQINPNFTVHFADPLMPTGDQVNRYLFVFNSSSIEVKRESDTGPKSQTVILLNRRPDEFPANEVAVELRVDRTSSRLHLLLNGEPEAAGVDPVATPPHGSGFVFGCNSPSGNPQEIRNIEVLDFDNTRERHRSENRGDTSIDSLISRYDDRWGGNLTKISKGVDGTVLAFKSDFQEQPLELLESDVSTVLFAKSGNATLQDKQARWVLKLRGEGSLHVTSCTFSEISVSALHPLLGPLEIKRTGVTALERLRQDHEEESKE